MPDSLLDLGGGVKMANPENFIDQKPTSAVEQFKSTLSTLNAVNQYKDYPIERAKKEADLTLAENDVYNIDVQNRKLRFELESAMAEERRKQINFFGDVVNKAVELYPTSPELSKHMMQQIMPNALFMDDKNGALHMFTQGKDGKIDTFAMDTEKLPPKERRDEEDKALARMEGQQEFKDYATVNQAFKSAKQAVANPTPAGDVSLVYNFITSMDPRTGVKEGEVALAGNIVGVSQMLKNKIDRLETGKALGPEASATRKEILEIISRKNLTLEKTVKEMGRNNYTISKSRRLDPFATVRPIGDLNVNSFMPLEELDKLPIDKLTPAQKLELYNFKTQGQP